VSQLAASYRTLVDSGRERRTDGLLKHLGIGDFGSVRAVDNLTSAALKTGSGLELLFDKPSQAGYILAVNRDTSAYLPLNIFGSNITIAPQAGGSLTLPANCVGTSQIQANAVQQLVASYVGAPGNVYTVGPWVESVIQGTGNFTGNPCRIEWSVNYAHSQTGGGCYFGIGYDGAPSYGLAIVNVPAGGYQQYVSGTIYLTIPSGTHRVAVFVGANPPQMTLYTGAYSTLFVTEQKR